MVDGLLATDIMVGVSEVSRHSLKNGKKQPEMLSREPMQRYGGNGRPDPVLSFGHDWLDDAQDAMTHGLKLMDARSA